jgi:hypothetical protein
MLTYGFACARYEGIQEKYGRAVARGRTALTLERTTADHFSSRPDRRTASSRHVFRYLKHLL